MPRSGSNEEGRCNPPPPLYNHLEKSFKQQKDIDIQFSKVAWSREFLKIQKLLKQTLWINDP